MESDSDTKPNTNDLPDEVPPTEDTPSDASEGDSAPGIWVPALKEAAVAFAAAALLLVVVYVFAFRQIHPEFVPFINERSSEVVIFEGKDFIPVSVASSRVEGSSLIVEGFNGDEAILALPRSFKAENYPFVKVNIKGFTRYSLAKLLWRRADDMSSSHALEFNRSGDEVTQLATVYGGDDYRGHIADVALLFFDGPALGFENNNDVEIIIESIEFRPFSAWHVAVQIYEDWTNPPLWQGYSNNIVRGIHKNGMLFPNAVANLLVVTGLSLVVIRRKFRQWRSGQKSYVPTLAVALSLCLYGWAFNDVLRWHWRVEQLIDTHERYAGLPLEERIRNNPIRCARFPKDCKADLLPYF